MNPTKPTGGADPNACIPPAVDPTRLVSVDDAIDDIAKQALDEARAREAREKAKRESR